MIVPDTDRNDKKNPVGIEIELRDTNTDGAPYRVPNYCNSNQSSWDGGRGRRYASRDGSGLVFLSDATISDGYSVGSGRVIDPVTGYLDFPDGTTYRITNGSVSWIRDRNGNTILFSYDPGSHRVTQITDQNGRVTNVTYGLASCSQGPSGGSCDKVTYTGWQGAQTIEIGKASTGAMLRSGYTARALDDLFPETVSGPSNGTPFIESNFSYIRFPDSTSIQFQYNDYGEVAQITLPTGGKMEYDWEGFGGQGTDGFFGAATGSGSAMIGRVVLARRTYADGSNLTGTTTYDYQYTTGSNGTPQQVTTEKTVDANNQVLSNVAHTFWGNAYDALFFIGIAYNNWQEGTETKTEYGNPVLKRVENAWENTGPVSWCNVSAGDPYSCSVSTGEGYPANDQHIASITTTLPDARQVSKVVYTYDPAFPNANNVSEQDEFDYGGSAPQATAFRKTATTYTYIDQINPSCGDPCAYLVKLPATVTVSDGNNVVYSKRSYTYDGAALQSYGAIAGHDSGSLSGSDRFGAGFTARGNVTAISDYADATQSSTPIRTTYGYDIAGNMVSSTDPNGHATTYSYADSYSGGGAAANTYAFMTQRRDALGHTQSWQYEYNSGKPSMATDANGVSTLYSFADPLDRLKQIRKAALAGGQASGVEAQTNISYTSPTRTDMYSDLNATGDEALHSATVYDGLGRTVGTLQYEGAGAIAVTSTYDALGQVLFRSNPLRPADAVNGTNYQYDLLGRIVQQTARQDEQGVTTTYSGNLATVRDEAGKVRSTTTDAGGRVAQVVEDPNGVVNAYTTYTYDPLDDLRAVNQSG